MTRIRWFLTLALLAIIICGAWLWWVKPANVDMAAYAPANSLLYLEANRPVEIVQAVSRTDAWKILDQLAGSRQDAGNPWLQRFVGWTGIGPIESVILARSQIAVVVTDLGATEEGSDTLRVKPEGAFIIETKTSERRIGPAVEQALRKLAEMTYGKPVQRRTTVDGVEYLGWTSPDGSREIVATIAGSVVIVGNTLESVQQCLAVSQGRLPSLKADQDLARVRSQLGADRALSFGYVPAANSARLLSVGVPVLLGRAPGNSEFQRLISSGASKVFETIGWSSAPYMTGIEDRFLISLNPSVVARLKPSFTPLEQSGQLQQYVPEGVASVTHYRFGNPLAGWQSVKGAVSSQLDALSAIVFSSLLKSALLSYGIEDPEAFLGSVHPEVATLRLEQDAERSVLIARVKDQLSLRELLSKTMHARTTNDSATLLEDPSGEFAANLNNELVVMGSPLDVRQFLDTVRSRTAHVDTESLRKRTFFTPLSSDAIILTYASDNDRVKRFVSAMVNARGLAPVSDHQIDQFLKDLPAAATETRFGEHGLERTTRSPLGQFSTFLPLLIPNRPDARAP